MKNCFKKLLFISFLFSLSCKASLLWDIQDGINFLNKAEYIKAKNYFESYVLNNPNDEDGYYFLGKSYLKIKAPALAKEYFEKSYNLASKEKNLEKIKFDDDPQTLKDYFDMAVDYFQEGNLKEADFYADLMLKLNVKDDSAWFLKAKIANSKGEKDLAVEYLNKAILYNNKLLKTNLAKNLNIYSIPTATKEEYSLFAFEEYYRGEEANALRDCLKYREFDTTNININILTAELYLLKNDIIKARETIENALKTSDNAGYYLIQAKTFKKEGNLNKQESALLKAYKLNPNNSKTLYEIGNFYLKKGDYKNSIKYFETLINIDDSFYEGYFGYIKSLVELGKTDLALNYIRKASKLNPNQSEINYLLSLICFKQGQFNSAEDYIQEAISKHQNPNYSFLKAEIEYYKGNYDNSFKILNDELRFKTVSNIQKEEIELYIKNYLKLEKYKNAQYNLNNPNFQLDKKSLLYKYNLYKIYKMEGNDKRADFLYKQIKPLKISTVKEYLDLSEIIYEEEGSDNAIKLLDNAIKKFSDEPELYSQKIKIYSMAKNFEKAKEVSLELSEKFN